jgi:mono/diheme cytochrome c family protein
MLPGDATGETPDAREEIMDRASYCSFAAACVVLALATTVACPARADDAAVQRGKYLITVAGCSDCHTPGALIGQPDMARYLAGSDTGFVIPGAGIYYGQNLTPDKETGLGGWSSEQIVAALRTGKTPDGRTLSPVMPYPAFANLADADAEAIAAFLKSLPAVKNKVGPLAANEKPKSGFVSIVMSADQYNALPAK